MLTRFKVCPSCGEENGPNSADCAHCGADILAEPVERRAPAVATASPTSDAPSTNPQNAIAEQPSGPFLKLESLVVPERVFVVHEGQTVGRADVSDVVIEGVPELDSVSRKMATFHRRGKQWFVQHVGTTNYIAVDGQQFDEDDDVAIRDGSVLGLALCQFFVRIPEAS